MEAAPGAMQDTPHLAAVAALNQYEHRLLHALRFIEESANARLAVPPSDIETQLNSLVEYVFAGEQEYTSAAERLNAQETGVQRLVDLQAQSSTVRRAIYTRLGALQGEAEALEGDIRSLQRLIARVESDPPLPASPYDAARALALHVAEAGVEGVPVGWRVGEGLPGGQQPFTTTAPAPAARVASAQPEQEEGGGADVAMEGSGQEEEEAVLVAHTAPPLPSPPHPPPAPTQGGAGQGQGQGQGGVQPQAQAQGEGEGQQSGAAPPPAPPPPPFLSLVASLPPTARAKLLALLPAGWCPGQPLPPALLAQDPRQLLAQLLGKQ